MTMRDGRWSLCIKSENITTDTHRLQETSLILFLPFSQVLRKKKMCSLYDVCDYLKLCFIESHQTTRCGSGYRCVELKCGEGRDEAVRGWLKKLN